MVIVDMTMGRRVADSKFTTTVESLWPAGWCAGRNVEHQYWPPCGQGGYGKQRPRAPSLHRLDDKEKLVGGTYVHWGRNAQASKQKILSGYTPDE